MGQKKAVSKDKDDGGGKTFFFDCSEMGKSGSKLKYK